MNVSELIIYPAFDKYPNIIIHEHGVITGNKNLPALVPVPLIAMSMQVTK
jgi:hypothetical protein